MDIFKLFGIITIDNTSANNAINETSDTAEQAESKLSIAFQKIGSAAIAVGHAMATGLAVGVTAMAALTGQALNLTGELEQNMGGSEAVFAEYAERMQDIAGTAYESMGLSASDFLATANKMGALFQGAGFGIEESATISADAMQRAADVASIMGIDVSVAMESIAGAAKGNFTMMDNLGVAINDTTLEIYAMENGLGALETTQDKVSAAMQMFMDRTAYAAGNYARENQTLAGSLTTAKAAFQNFLTGVTSAEQFARSLTNAGDVITGNLIELVPRLIEGLTELTELLLPEIPSIMETILPGILDGAMMLLQGLTAILPEAFVIIGGIFGGILPEFLQLGIDIILQIVNGLASGLPGATPAIVEVIIQMVQIIISNVPLFISAAAQLIEGLTLGLMAALPILINALPSLLENVTTALISSLPILIECISFLMESIAENLPVILNLIIAVLPTLFDLLADSIVALVPVLIQAALDLTIALCEALPEICQALFDAMPLIVEGILLGLFNLGARIRVEILDPAISVFVDWLNNIKTRLTGAVNTAKEFLISGFNTAKDALATIADGIAAKFESAFNSLVDIVRTPLNAIIGFVNQVIDALNSIRIDIPDWVPEYGGSTFGINIPNISYLAKGGVITEPALLGYNPLSGRGVVAGEAGDEAIAPIGVLQAYIEEAVARQNYALVAVLERILEAIITMDANMGGNLSEALENLTISADKREFARLVKAVN